MLSILQGFVHELRMSGLPVSMTENLDAMRSLAHVAFHDRDAFRTALATTLVKNHGHRAAFEATFEVYFSFSGGEAFPSDDQLEGSDIAAAGWAEGGGPTGTVTDDELAEMLFAALASMNRDGLREIAALAVSRYAGMEPGRPVGGAYYLYRTLRRLGVDELMARLAQRAREQGEIGEGAYDERLVLEDFERRTRVLRDLVEAEIRRRLVMDRGAPTLARSLRKPLPEDVDFMHASRDEMLSMSRSIAPLTRALAARLAQRRRHRHRGHLDFRQTVRHSLSYGGVPAEPKFKKPKPSKPEIMVIADISGSVASFARFTLQFVYAMAGEFSKVRSWVFVDGVDEVTRFFQESEDVAAAIHRVNTEADVVWVDGHSDYGHAFEAWNERHLREVTHKTSIIILGDARNNYHAPQAWVLAEMRRRARKLYWLNPEPQGYWDTGDSIVSQYGVHCDGVHECRNLRQLQRFVASVVDS